MMKKTYFVTILFVLAINANAQPPLQWAKNIGGSRGDDIVVDAAGSVYTTGYFSGVRDFDPGPSTFYMTADGCGADDAFVSKLDVNGNFVWAKRLGESSTNYGNALAVDANGNIYTVGSFAGTVDFDPGVAVYDLTSAGQSDIFISKLDATGNFVWAQKIGSNTAQVANSIIVDASGNIIVAGNFVGAVDFDPGPLTFTLNGGGNNDCFIFKMDAGGNFIWAKQVVGNYSQGDAISTDALGNLYVCGNYNSTADLDPGSGANNVTATGGSADVFLIKLDAAGNFVWGKSFGGIGTDVAESIKADAAGNVYVTGNFPFTVDFDPGPTTFNISVAGSTDVYLLKLDINGNFLWAKTFAGVDAEAGRDVIVDATGNVYVTGLFLATVDLDPGPGVYNLTSFVASTDIFIVCLDAAGNFVYAIRFGGTTLDAGLALFVNGAGILHATGYFEGAVDFDPGAGIATLNSAEGRTFIIKLGGSVLPITLLSFSGTANANGNLLKWETSREKNTNQFEIEKSEDGVSFTTIAILPAAGNSSHTLRYSYLHGHPINGNNYYRLKMVDIDGRFTYSPVIVISNNAELFSVKIFPNPVEDILQIHIQAEKKEMILFNLFNTEGKIIASKKMNLQKGSNYLNWNMQTLAKGNYFLAADAANIETIKIIKK